MAKSNIKVRGFLLCAGGPVPIEQLTPEEREAWQRHMCERLSEEMSDYYTQHKAEFEAL